LPEIPRWFRIPSSSAPSKNRINPSKKLNPTRRSREGTLGILDIPGLFMQSNSLVHISGPSLVLAAWNLEFFLTGDPKIKMALNLKL
jgi:hypothetical protein